MSEKMTKVNSLSINGRMKNGNYYGIVVGLWKEENRDNVFIYVANDKGSYSLYSQAMRCFTYPTVVKEIPQYVVDKIVRHHTNGELVSEIRHEVVKDITIENIKESNKEQEVIKSNYSKDEIFLFIKDDSVASCFPDEVEESVKGSVFEFEEELMVITDMGNRYLVLATDNINIEYDENEKPVAILRAIGSADDCLVMLSDSGMLKKQSGTSIGKMRGSTKSVYPPEKGKVVFAINANVEDEIILVTEKAKVLKTGLKEIRSVESRYGAGVAVMKVETGDNIITMDVVKEDSKIIIIDNDGREERLNASSFNTKGRGGKGVRLCRLNDEGVIESIKVM